MIILQLHNINHILIMYSKPENIIITKQNPQQEADGITMKKITYKHNHHQHIQIIDIILIHIHVEIHNNNNNKNIIIFNNNSNNNKFGKNNME